MLITTKEFMRDELEAQIESEIESSAIDGADDDAEILSEIRSILFKAKGSSANANIELEIPDNKLGYFETVINAVERDDWSEHPAKWRRAGRQLYIDLGVYGVIDEKEIANTYCSSGKAWDFIMDGKKYVFRKHLEVAQ